MCIQINTQLVLVWFIAKFTTFFASIKCPLENSKDFPDSQNRVAAKWPFAKRTFALLKKTPFARWTTVTMKTIHFPTFIIFQFGKPSLKNVTKLWTIWTIWTLWGPHNGGWGGLTQLHSFYLTIKHPSLSLDADGAKGVRKVSIALWHFYWKASIMVKWGGSEGQPLRSTWS